jgi:hypothetical protein
MSPSSLCRKPASGRSSAPLLHSARLQMCNSSANPFWPSSPPHLRRLYVCLDRHLGARGSERSNDVEPPSPSWGHTHNDSRMSRRPSPSSFTSIESRHIWDSLAAETSSIVTAPPSPSAYDPEDDDDPRSDYSARVSSNARRTKSGSSSARSARRPSPQSTIFVVRMHTACPLPS